MTGPQLSVVVPMLNEAANVAPFLARLYPVLERMGCPFEVCCVDDGSTDDTLARLRAELPRRPGLRVVRLARNFGQHAAVQAGFATARGEWIVTLDADLQNPPEEIPRLVAALADAHDVVGTLRQRRHDGPFRRWASRTNRWLLQRWVGVDLGDPGCMLRGYHRSIAAALVHDRGGRAFLPALARLRARNAVDLPVAHASRSEGASRYSVWKLLRLQLDLLTSLSVGPLRLLLVLGVGLSLCALGFGVLLGVCRLVYGAAWAGEGVFTLFAVLFFFVGAQFVALGLLGEYLGRVFQQVREWPAFVVREVEESSVASADPVSKASVARGAV